MILLLILLSAPASWPNSWLHENGAALDCYARPLRDPALEEISWLAKSIHRLLGTEGLVDKAVSAKTISAEEAKVLKKYPALGLVLGNIRCRSQALAVTICDVDPKIKGSQTASQDEELDALRHFFFAFLLAEAKGPELATLYTTAHEGDPRNWTDRELMDLENNQAAIDLYRDMIAAGAEPRLGDESLTAIALSYLKEKKLVTISRGRSRCAHPEIHEMRAKDLIRKLKENYHTLKNFSSCQLPMGLF